VTLPVTSCSAERAAMSRIKSINIAYGQLWWMNGCLHCLATEKDIMNQIPVEDIIIKFAESSEPVRRQHVA